jgi:GNAT superfamily N-acetyltransferase
VESINALDMEKRTQFLLDMSIIGDVLLKTLNAQLINYSILGNLDRSLHAHIHPRYDSEKEEYRNNGYGGLLMEKALKYFETKPIKRIELKVVHGNDNAKKIYEHYGFRMLSQNMAVICERP